MSNWLKNLFTTSKMDVMHGISIIHTIRLYTHIKNIPFQSFMIWAFGDNWNINNLNKLNKLHVVWNERHGVLAKIPEIKDLSSIIFQMVDWYIQINKPV